MRWKPLGLYNGMTATCAGYAARAALWYQGESNTGDVADDYGPHAGRNDWMLAQGMGGRNDCRSSSCSCRYSPSTAWRTVVGHSSANTSGSLQPDRGCCHRGDPRRGQLERFASVEQECGRDRLFAAAQRLVYGKDDAPRSPESIDVRLADGRLTITFDDGTGDCGLDTLDGADPGEFELVWRTAPGKQCRRASTATPVVIAVPWRRPTAVRYAWRNAPNRGLLCGSNGLPVPPFAEPIA